jgi:hypothetical protein
LQRENANATITETLALTYALTDIRNPQHHQHREFQKLRGEISYALKHQKYMRDFNPQCVATTAPCPQTFARLTDLLQERASVEKALENLLDDVDSSGAPLDPMPYLVADLNRHLFTIYVGFLPPEQTASDASKTSSSSQRHSKPSIPAMQSMRKHVLILNTRPNAAEHEICPKLCAKEYPNNLLLQVPIQSKPVPNLLQNHIPLQDPKFTPYQTPRNPSLYLWP